jgi:hypothetical protein
VYKHLLQIMLAISSATVFIDFDQSLPNVRAYSSWLLIIRGLYCTVDCYIFSAL